MSWTSSLAQAETDESAYRAARRGSLPDSTRWDARGAVLLGNWIGARAAASSVKVPASNASYWANVAARAVVAMGPSWSIVQNQLGTPPAYFMPVNYDRAPNGSAGSLDGLFGGLVSQWSTDVWTANGRTLPSFGFPPMEDMTYLFANTITNAGAT
jgi:hypothetical protein